MRQGLSTNPTAKCSQSCSGTVSQRNYVKEQDRSSERLLCGKPSLAAIGVLPQEQVWCRGFARTGRRQKLMAYPLGAISRQRTTHVSKMQPTAYLAIQAGAFAVVRCTPAARLSTKVHYQENSGK